MRARSKLGQMKKSKLRKAKKLIMRKKSPLNPFERGDRIVAMNRNIAEVLPSRKVAGCSSFKVAIGDFYARLSDAELEPAKTIPWYYWGPPGAVVNVRVERAAGSGGHVHSNGPGNGPAGSLDRTSFTLGPNYPQNNRNPHRTNHTRNDHLSENLAERVDTATPYVTLDS
jgi:hypothetical protein